jgi:hypothetical protein
MMHAILGDGEMTRRELTEALADLWKADELEGQSFWFLIQGKSEPTETDKTLVTWLEKNGIYYEIITDDTDGVDPIYAEPQEVHTVQKLSSGVISLLKSKPEEDEPAELLALFFNVNDLAASEDKWLNGVIEAAFDAGFPTRALNDGMVEIDLSSEAEEAEAEPEEEVATVTPIKAAAKKSVAKKAAAKPADIPVPAEDEVTEAPDDREAANETPSREELEDMDLDEVKEVAAKLGITLPPRTRVTTYIDHILGEKAPTPPAEAEISEVAIVATNGHIEADDIAERVADILWARFSKAFA